MPGIANTSYATSRNILIGGVARTYAYQTYDPRVVGGILNAGNVINMNPKPLNGFTKQRGIGFGAEKVTDITRYNRTGFVRSPDSFVTTGISYYRSGDATTPASGILLDPSKVERVFSMQPLEYADDNYVVGIQYVREKIVAGMRAVFGKSLDDFLPNIFADIRLKKDYDDNPESGEVLTFAADTINAAMTQTTDLTDLTGTQEELAALGALLLNEIKDLVYPVWENNPHEAPRLIVPSKAWRAYKTVLEAYKGIYSARRRADDTESSGTLDFIQRTMIDIDGIGILKFPDSAVPQETDTWRCLVLTPSAICHVVNSVPIVGSTDLSIDSGGYAPSTIEEAKENLDRFFDALGNEAATNFRDVLNLKGSDRDVIYNIMNKNIGANAMYNYIRNTIERLPMGTGTEAKHYYICSQIGEGTLRMNPYVMREWRIPDSVLTTPTPPPFSATTRTARTNPTIAG